VSHRLLVWHTGCWCDTLKIAHLAQEVSGKEYCAGAHKQNCLCALLRRLCVATVRKGSGEWNNFQNKPLFIHSSIHSSRVLQNGVIMWKSRVSPRPPFAKWFLTPHSVTTKSRQPLYNCIHDNHDGTQSLTAVSYTIYLLFVCLILAYLLAVSNLLRMLNEDAMPGRSGVPVSVTSASS